MQIVAIIDMGTNTFHLLIAKVEGGKHKVLLDEKHAVGLGRGGITDGLISEEAMDRAMKALHFFKGLCDQYKVNRVVTTGTSAVRSARNQSVYIHRIKEELNWDVIVLTGEEEAMGIYQGVSAAVNIPHENALIVDIGGGSVEFILCRAQVGILWKQSFEIGGQRLMDKFHHHEPIAVHEKEKIEQFLAEQLKPLLKAVHDFGGVHVLVGSSGSFDTLVDMYCAELQHTLAPEASSFSLPIDAYRRIAVSLFKKNKAERLAIPGMIPLRVDMIVVALVLIDWLIEQLEIDKIDVSFYALKEGLLRGIVGSMQ
jgi:exopolyphosphatase / guanosine-5'-triphosphate,3'-diphosphate pyrophosphatase